MARHRLRGLGAFSAWRWAAVPSHQITKPRAWAVTVPAAATVFARAHGARRDAVLDQEPHRRRISIMGASRWRCDRPDHRGAPHGSDPLARSSVPAPRAAITMARDLFRGVGRGLSRGWEPRSCDESRCTWRSVARLRRRFGLSELIARPASFFHRLRCTSSRRSAPFFSPTRTLPTTPPGVGEDSRPVAGHHTDRRTHSLPSLISEELAELIPHSLLEVISGAAHGLMAEAPRFNDAVLRFLTGWTQPTTPSTSARVGLASVSRSTAGSRAL